MTGDTKEATKHQCQLSAEIEFETAKRLLIEKYGDPYRITAPTPRKSNNGPQIKAGDTIAYQKFQNFLVKHETIGRL